LASSALAGSYYQGEKIVTRMTIVTGVLLALAGCQVPQNAVQWLPDSSGFVYTKRALVIGNSDRDDLFHYSAVSWHISEEGVRETPIVSGRGRPSLSPDGKKLAFATMQESADGVEVQIHIYDLSGHEIHKSKPYLDPRLGTRPYWADVVWSPNGHCLLICTTPQPGKTLETLAYDTNASDFRLFEGVSAPLMMDDVLGCSPCSSDGRGFLAARMKEDSPKGTHFEELLFVEWDGQQHRLKMEPQADCSVGDIWEKIFKGLDGRRLEGPLPKARWNGATLVLVVHDGYVRLDTKTCLVTYQHDVNVAKQSRDFSRNRVCDAVVLGNGRFVLQSVLVSPGASVDLLLQVVDTHTGNTKVLDAGTITLLQKLLFLSPNRKYAAAICPLEGSFSSLSVVDENGEILLQWPRTHDRSQRIRRAKSILAAATK
jgi:hypothetical protein